MWALVHNGKVKDIIRHAQSFRDNEGRLHPRSVLLQWPLDKLKAIGIYPVVSVYEPSSPYDMEIKETEEFVLTTNRVERLVKYKEISLEGARFLANIKLKKWYAKRISQPILYNGHYFGTDTKSHRTLVDAIMLHLVEWELGEDDVRPPSLFTTDGKQVTLSHRQLLEIGQHVFSHRQTTEALYRDYEKELQNMDSVQAIKTFLSKLEV